MMRMPVIAALASAALIASLIWLGLNERTAADTPRKPVWTQLTEHAAFPESYNYPVHVARDGRFVALHSQGTWASRDGATWTKLSLPHSGMNAAYLNYVQHDGASWALGKVEGNYLGFTIDPVVQRTDDYVRWDVVGRSDTLPKRVFQAAASFRGALWLLGGYDGKGEVAEVWRSSDGLTWERVVTAAPWSPRASAKAVVFKNRLFVIGGGRVDGPSANDVWSSADGIAWERMTSRIAPEEPVGYTSIAHDGKLWLVGANRSGRFRSEMLVSSDGKQWQAQSAPWSPRGGVAAWSHGGALYITGGKFSTVVDGETVFQYRNDVWRMTRAQTR